jgi:hypothetical protein
MTSIYRRYYKPIQGVMDKLKCDVDVKKDGNVLKCGEYISSQKASVLQTHLENKHSELYATIRASPKAIRDKNQTSLEGFGVATPSKVTGSMRNLVKFFATSTAPVNILKNEDFKVSFVFLIILTCNLDTFESHSELQSTRQAENCQGIE